MTEVAREFYKACKMIKEHQKEKNADRAEAIAREVQLAADRIESLGAKRDACRLRERLAEGPVIMWTASQLEQGES